MNIPYKRENLEWRQIEEFPDYMVSNYGDIYRKEKDIIDKVGRSLHYDERYFWSEEQSKYGGSHGDDYLGVHLSGKKEYSHRLAAKTFIPNPLNKPEVNHKDGNTYNNYCGCKENNYEDSNLEWVTTKENMEHASKNGLINRDSIKRKIQCAKNREKVNYDDMKRAVVQIDPKTGKYIEKYESVSEAGRALGILPQSIESVLRKDGYHKTAKGFGWIYLDEYNPTKDYSIVNNQGHGTKRVSKIDLQSNKKLETYNSIKEAGELNNYPVRNYIGDVCNGHRKSYKGFGWCFEE